MTGMQCMSNDFFYLIKILKDTLAETANKYKCIQIFLTPTRLLDDLFSIWLQPFKK